MTLRMREEPIRSLLLLDANPEERRLISAIAGRAGWSVVGAADEEMALALLQGPHGREVLAALLGSWDPEKGPQLIASLREQRQSLPVIVLSHGLAFPLPSTRCVREPRIFSCGRSRRNDCWRHWPRMPTAAEPLANWPPCPKSSRRPLSSNS
jgi:hypothetical protein